MDRIAAIALAVTAILLMITQIKWDLQMMQQNSYRNERFLRWLRTSGECTGAGRLTLLVMLVLALSTFMRSWIVMLILVAAIIIKCIVAWRKKYKKPLVMTKRVWRLALTEIILLLAVIAAVAIVRCDIMAVGIAALIAATFSYAFTMAVNWLLKPIEEAINNSFINDAKRLLAQMPDMKIVAITGSFGKTSTKHYLNRILSEKYSVLMTPGSYNTPMGVVRTVRELMQPYNDLFIVEMGAKNLGDILEICDIVHPQIGIITAVGEQHLESFKTIENVQRTKFELIDALPTDGLAVLNDDFEYVANRPVENVEAIRYSVNESHQSDFHAQNITYSPTGTRFSIVGQGKCIELETKLVGECNVSNLTAAVIVALKLGVPEAKIRYAVSRIEQVEHRLTIKRTPAGLTIIDDAFNSNPVGSRMALDVLAQMTAGKRIIITPGMIELGSKQEYYNTLLGEQIASAADVAIVVGQYNRDAITQGIAKANSNGTCKVHTVDSFSSAQTLMLSLAHAGDTVLYENDLPDSFK